MHRIASLVCMISLASCLQLGTQNQADGGAAGSSSAGVDAGSNPVGAGCASDPATGVTLCTAISSCPDEVVDQGQFPNCGYRIRGSVLDLECLCGDALCPIGTPLNCSQVRALLADQSGLAVCAGVSEGRCTTLPTATPSGGSCDPECRASCAGDPTCAVLCGC